MSEGEHVLALIYRRRFIPFAPEALCEENRTDSSFPGARLTSPLFRCSDVFLVVWEHFVHQHVSIKKNELHILYCMIFRLVWAQSKRRVIHTMTKQVKDYKGIFWRCFIPVYTHQVKDPWFDSQILLVLHCWDFMSLINNNISHTHLINELWAEAWSVTLSLSEVQARPWFTWPSAVIQSSMSVFPLKWSPADPPEYS